MGLQFAQIITELGKGVALGGELESREDGTMDFAGASSAELGTAVKQDFQESEGCGCPGS